MAASSDDPVISYPIRDILERIEGKLEQALRSLSLKADHADVLAIGKQVGVIESRVDALEQERAARQERKSDAVAWRRWAIPTVAAILASAATLVSVLH